MEVEWDTRQTELRGRTRAADPAAPGTETGKLPAGRVQGPTGGTPPPARTQTPVLLPPIWSQTKTHKRVQTADCTILEFSVFVSFSPLPAPPFLPRPFAKGVGRRSQPSVSGNMSRRPGPAQKPGSRGTPPALSVRDRTQARETQSCQLSDRPVAAASKVTPKVSAFAGWTGGVWSGFEPHVFPVLLKGGIEASLTA